ncbi:MAG: M2 family metallopeptidase, partial [Gemmobacter sp.]
MEARAFLKDAERQIAAKSHMAAQAYWDQATNITPETSAAAAEQGAEFTKLVVSLANASKAFDIKGLPPQEARKIQ